MRKFVLMIIPALICGMVLTCCNEATKDDTDLSLNSNEVEIDAVVKFAEVSPSIMPYEVKFDNISDEGVSYFWDFGDGSTSNERNPIHTFKETGVYCVTLTVAFVDDENGKKTELNFTDRVIVSPLPVFVTSSELIADFDFLVGSSSCKDAYYVMFINTSPYMIAEERENQKYLMLAAVSYLWDFGDGYVSCERDPVHEFTKAGTYDVTLTITGEDGLKKSITKQVVINEI